MKDYIYNTTTDESYKGKSLVIIGASIKVNVDKVELLNGYNGAVDITTDPNFPFKEVVDKPVYLKLSFGRTDSILYVSARFIFKSPLSEDDINKLKTFYEGILKESTDFKEVPYNEEVLKLELYNKDQVYVIRQDKMEAPEGYTFITDLVVKGEDSAMYQDFLNNKLMFDRLKYLCDKKGKKVPEEAITGVMLPVHQKDPVTGSTCVMNEVISIFEQFKLAQNYIRGFEEDSSENQMGLLMMLSPEFAEYILMTAKRVIMGKVPDEKSHRSQIEKAIKFANKHRKEYLNKDNGLN